MRKESIIDIAWSDNKLEKACSTDRAGQRRWGADHWKLLRRRLASLRASPTLGRMDGVPGGCHPLSADRHGQFGVDLWGPFELILVPDHDPIPKLEDGGIDRDLVTKILIVEVVDYHGR
jgi:toxin HigB-1